MPSKRWLDARSVERHFHVRLNQSEGFERIARFTREHSSGYDSHTGIHGRFVQRVAVKCADIYMYPEILKFKRTDFHLASKIVDAGYDCARTNLQEWLSQPEALARRPDLRGIVFDDKGKAGEDSLGKVLRNEGVEVPSYSEIRDWVGRDENGVAG
jgi:hypothetical protein